MRFYYSDFKAVMPGISTPQQWQKFIDEDVLPVSEDVPPCPVPVMIRRRMTALGRLALTVLADIGPENQEAVVYASSWGEVGRTACLLEDIIQDAQAMSPAGFSSSVHNAIAGIAAIWQKNHAAGPALTAGTLTTEAALVQCAAMLAAGVPSVILLRYDEPLPLLWQDRKHRFDCPKRMFAWGMRLRAEPLGGENAFELYPAGGLGANIDECARQNCPGDLAFLLTRSSSRIHTDYSSRGYRWAR